jgi:hypothetical protein
LYCAGIASCRDILGLDGGANDATISEVITEHLSPEKVSAFGLAAKFLKVNYAAFVERNLLNKTA